MKDTIINKKFSYNYIGIFKYLILINIAVFFLTNNNASIYFNFSIIPYYVFENFQYYRILTSMFLHYDLNHLFSNMLGLFFFGSALEKAIGSKEFLLYYMLCGLLSGLLSCLMYYILKTNVMLIGASAAIFAILLGFAVFYPNAKILLFFVIPIKAPYLVALYGAIELISQVTGATGNISHLAHLFGLLTSYLYLRIRMRIRVLRVWSNS